MTHDEAVKVTRIMFLADFGCSICAEKLCQQFIHEFPEFGEMVNTEFKNEFGIKLGTPIIKYRHVPPDTPTQRDVVESHESAGANPVPGIDLGVAQ